MAIRKKLEAAVAAALGSERADFFFRNGKTLDFILREFPADPEALWSRESRITHTFILPEKEPGQVRLYRRSGRSGSGMPFPAAHDRYAPESLKPVLGRWRDGVAARNQAPRSAAPVIANASKWDEAAPYVDLPKQMLESFSIPGLTREETLTPEIVALLGLTEPQQQAVIQLYREMKEKFEELERANFSRVAPEKYSFVLKAFPKESEALKRQWRQELQELAGASRGVFLDRKIRSYPSMKPGPMAGMNPGRRLPPGKPWLYRGGAEVRFDFRIDAGADGRPIYRYEVKSAGPDGEQARGDSLNGWRAPAHWEHLFTPEMLAPPVAL